MSDYKEYVPVITDAFEALKVILDEIKGASSKLIDLHQVLELIDQETDNDSPFSITERSLDSYLRHLKDTLIRSHQMALELQIMRLVAEGKGEVTIK